MRVAKLLVSVALVLALAAPAAARGRAEDALSGFGELEQKDLRAATLVIKGRTYHVVDTTRLVDRDGKPMTLAQLGVRQPGEKGLFEILGARFEAIERGDKLVLISLELTDSPD